MARLSHPNVIAVHDVGVHEAMVFVAMELVDGGETLATWLSAARRGWREVLEVFLQAGEGLAAAHHKGLIHRDIKPDNIMIDGAGRVRVMDFGLARPDGEELAEEPRGVDDPDAQITSASLSALSVPLTQHGSILGTPAYMAPEQHMGLATDPRTDQFAFCVALWEGVFGERPFAGETVMSLAIAVSQGQLRAAPRGVAPGWLQRACRRGMSAEPGERWPDMRALLDALRRGQARVRSRRWIAGAAGVAAVVGGLLGARALERRAVIAACVEDGASVEELWPGRAEAVRAGMLGSELAYAAASHERLTPWLERWAGSWRVARQQACERHELARETSPELYARSRSCLEVARARLEGLVEQLERGEAPAIQRAVAVAAALRPPGECLERARLERGRWPDESRRDEVLELQRRLAKIAAHEHAGSYERGLESAELALADAAALGWAPMTAAARLRVGALLERAGKYEEAVRELKRAYLDAGRAGADATAADAALALSYTLGSLARHEDGLAWGEHAEMMIDRLGERERLRGAELLHNLGTLRWIRSEYREALELFHGALALREGLLSAEHPLLGSSLSTIGTTYHLLGETRRAIEHADRALAIFERAFGPSHPNVANVLNNRGNFYIGIEEFEAAIESIERALEIREAALGREHPDTLGSINSLGTAHFYLERYDDAHRLWSEALRGSLKTVGPDHPDTAGVYQNLGNVERERGALEAAREHHARALEVFERALGLDHVVVAGVLNDLGLTHDVAGKHAEAVKAYERALSIYERHAGDAPNKYRLQFTLARSLLAQGERARALKVARESLAGWRALDDETYDAKLRELERWIAAHEDPEGG